MRDVFKQRRCEQIQTSDLKTGKQKDCIRQKGGSCSNCKGKTVQNNESSNKLLPAHADLQLTLCAVSLPNPACWGGHSLEDWFLSITFSFQLVFSPYLVTLWCEFLVSGLVKWDSWCTESLLLLWTRICSRSPQSPTDRLWIQIQDFLGFIQPLQMKVHWDARWADIAQVCGCFLCQ